MKPLKNRVLVLPTDQETESVSSSGIVLIEQEVKPSTRGVVVALGPDVEHTVNVGDHVQYSQHSGVEIEWENKVHIIMRDTEIICVL